ncbi:polysaccharide biosynthesis tyrosine autokinase [Actinoplanes sp. NPDC051470]|uniref:polysaccharide biosynthesis tyrosine autokinase n=1 Tax=Actinoplanes sp. NPDC051470 TaxID=3157224 RepID=UPI0034165F51
MSVNGGPGRLLRVYGPWIVLVTAVVMAAAFGASRTAPVEYRSTAVVVVEARVRSNTTPVPPDMGTEKELASSGVVVDPAAWSLGVDPGVLLTGLTISVAPDANVLTFAYTSTEAAIARQRAGALAEAYVAYRNAGEAKEPAGTAKTPVATTSTQHATLVTPAGLPDGPVSRPVWIDLAIGLVAGLVLGVGSALIRDRLDDRIRGRADFERVARATVLATVPRVRGRRGGSPSPVTLRAPESPAAEAYRYLRSRLQPLLSERDRTILVTSADDGEGRTTTAANLAAALAMAGRTVILVDADLRRPGLHTVFDMANGAGLTTILAGDAAPADVVQAGPVPRLRLVTAGPAAGAAADLLEGSRLDRTLRGLHQLCDIVVLDSGPVLSVSDGIALAAVSDHVLLVGDYRRTTRGHVVRALAELAEVVDGNISGVLLNAPKSAGGLTPRGREHTPVARAQTDATAVLPAVAAEPGRGAARNGAAAPTTVPVSPGPASTLYTSAAAAPLTPPDEPRLPRRRGEMERRT